MFAEAREPAIKCQAKKLTSEAIDTRGRVVVADLWLVMLRSTNENELAVSRFSLLPRSAKMASGDCPGVFVFGHSGTGSRSATSLFPERRMLFEVLQQTGDIHQ
jgi:hypothetical protein